jgi:hypothetical protein
LLEEQSVIPDIVHCAATFYRYRRAGGERATTSSGAAATGRRSRTGCRRVQSGACQRAASSFATRYPSPSTCRNSKSRAAPTPSSASSSEAREFCFAGQHADCCADDLNALHENK